MGEPDWPPKDRQSCTTMLLQDVEQSCRTAPLKSKFTLGHATCTRHDSELNKYDFSINIGER